MRTNGLIFLVIVAIWAVYLLQHWVRRREHLATARSVDRFSEAMRVLERRRTAPARRDPAPVRAMTDGRAERPTAPTVSVKPSRPSLRAGAAMQQESKTSVSQTDSTARVSVGSRFFRALGAVTPARVRAWALVTAGLVFLLTVVLTPLRVTPWWSPLLALVALAGVVAWLRSTVIRAQAAQRDSAPESASGATARVATAQPATGMPSTASAAAPAPVERSDAPVFDVNGTDEQAVEVEPQEVPVEAPAPGTWAPVAVPPPTYTLKARADRPEREPAATVEPASTAAKYADTPVEELPFDGLALDEDLEDLPAVHRAG